MSDDLKQIVKQFPARPGVYLFKSGAKILYVGKALSLKDRVSSYFASDADTKAAGLTQEADAITYVETGSEFEALLLEARLIKTHLPVYNKALKDDKSFLYVFLSLGEEYPKVFVTRKPKVLSVKGKWELYDGLKGVYYGPFLSSAVVKKLVRQIRKIIPFCQQKSDKRPCFYSHLGLCSPCPGYITHQNGSIQTNLVRKYRKQLYLLRNILEGKSTFVEKQLIKDMNGAARDLDFETAANIKKQLMRLTYLKQSRDISGFLKDENFHEHRQQQATDELKYFLKPFFVQLNTLEKIECYDISNFAGQQPVGAQTVSINGIIEPSLYRKYHIRSIKRPNDTGMMKEMLIRRLKHPEWTFPDLIVVDGGKTQVSTAVQVIKSCKLNIPIIGLAKRLEEVVIPLEEGFEMKRLPSDSPALQLLQQLRDEAHRFGLTFHRKIRNALLTEG